MKSLALLLLLILIAVGGVSLIAYSASAQGDGFIIERADAVRTADTSGSGQLNLVLEDVSPRFIVQFANQLRHATLSPAPSSLVNKLDDVAPHYVIQFANGNRFIPVTTLPSGFISLLEDVAPRFFVQFANGMRQTPLSYPRDLIGDEIPPEVQTPSASVAVDGVVTITWDTDEFATSEVRYGTTSGNYTDSVIDPLYTLSHEIVLSDLPYGTYYWRAVSTDLSGNESTSAEMTFTVSPDSTAPIISNIAVTVRDDDSMRVTWTTNEPANSEIRFGTSSGNYSTTINTAALKTSHALATQPLSPGTYYLRIRSTDSSGNTGVSSERTFVISHRIYLPTVLAD